MTNSSRARLLRRMYAASVPLKRVFSGTSTAPAVTAPSAETIQSRVFGAQIATRSPGSTPEARHPAAARSTRSPSSAYESRTRPSATASAEPYRRAAARTSSGMLPHSSSPRITRPPAAALADYPSD